MSRNPSPLAQRRKRTYSFDDMVALQGLGSLSDRAQTDNLRRLADSEGMPLPLNPRWRGGKAQKHNQSIGRKSTWDADKVDEWEAERSLPELTREDLSTDTYGIGASLEAEMAARAAKLGSASA